MIAQPSHSKIPEKSKLSSEGQSRRDEMLSELQDAMTLHHVKLQNRKRIFRLSALLVVLISSCSWMVWQSMKSGELDPNSTAEMKKSSVESVANKDIPKIAESNSGGTSNQNESMNRSLPKKKTLIEKYVVSTVDVETRQMESINDEEMLELLKKAGVRGWIAEIGDERVVLDSEGKRL